MRCVDATERKLTRSVRTGLTKSKRSNQIVKRKSPLKAAVATEAHRVKDATIEIEAVSTTGRVDMTGKEVTEVDRENEHHERRKKVKLTEGAKHDLV